MHVKFNSLNQHEPLVISLCDPGSRYDDRLKAPTRIIGILTDVCDDELILNFNTTSELNLRVYRIDRKNGSDLSTSVESEETIELFNKIQNRRLLFVKDIGYFVIEDVVIGCEDGKSYKDIKAESIETELRGRKVPFIEDNTYSFISLLSMIIPNDSDEKDELKSLRWRVEDNIPSALQSKYRTFEEVDINKDRLSFLMEDMQNAYECLFEFDIINRIVRVYDQNNYTRPTDIHLTKNDLIKTISITENSDNLYTAISVVGDGDETISAINPIGGNVIYDFTYYLPWMSQGLREKVVAWQSLVKSKEQEYYEASLGYFTELDIVSFYDLEIERLESLKDTYEKCKVSKTNPWLTQLNKEIVKIGNSLVSGVKKIISKISGIEREYMTTSSDGVQVAADIIVDLGTAVAADILYGQNIIDLESAADVNIAKAQRDIKKSKDERSPHVTQRDKYKSKMDEILSAVNMKNFFGDDIDELNNFIFEGNYKDDYVIITDIMSHDEIHNQLKTMYDRAKLTLSKASYPMQEFNLDVENFIFAKEFEHWSEQLETGCAINIEIEDGDIARLFLTNIVVNYQDQTLSLTFGNRLDRFDMKSIFENVLGGISRSSNSISFIKDTIYPIKNGEIDKVKKAIESARNLTMSNALTAEDEDVVIDGSGYLGRLKNKDGTFDPRQIKITGRNILFTNDGWNSCSTAIGEIFTDTSQTETTYGINAKCLIGEAIFGQNLTIRNNNSSVVIDSNGVTIKCENNSTPFKIYKINSNGSTENLLWVDSTGVLNVKGKITATSGSFTGKIVADEGEIGGVYIKKGFITTDNSTTQWKQSGLWLNSSSDETSWSNGTTGVTLSAVDRWIMTMGESLAVSKYGVLIASEAHITGDITANSLSLGSNASLSKGTYSDTNSSTGCEISKDGLLKASNAIIRGKIYASDGTFKGELKAATGTFKGALEAATGTFAGQLSAATGSFSGRITASEGTIGDCIQIGGGSAYYTSVKGIFMANASYEAGMKSDFSDGSNLCFYVYKKDGGWKKTFGVSNDGHVHATYFSLGTYSDPTSTSAGSGVKISDSGAAAFGAWVTCQGLTQISDIRFKNSIISLDDRVRDISLQTFFEEIRPSIYKINGDNKFDFGFIAQNVKSALDKSGFNSSEFNIVREDENGYYSLAYNQISTLNTYMIQDLLRRCDALERKIEILERSSDR